MLAGCLYVQGEIDEREFLTTDFGALASPRTMPGSQPAGLFAKPSLAQGASYVAPGSQGVGRKLAIGLQSPLPIMHLGPAPPATPVTQTMGSVSWLRNLAKDLSLGPPPAVLRYLAAAGPSVASAVTQRVKEAATGVFSVGAGPMTGLPSLHSFPELQESVARERRHEVRHKRWDGWDFVNLTLEHVKLWTEASPMAGLTCAVLWSLTDCAAM